MSDSAAAPPGAVTDPSAVTTEEVRFAGANGDEVAAYLAAPATGDGPFPAIIVIHEAFGLNDHIRDVARRFANQGYVALAPDLYTREGAPPADDFPVLLGKMFSVPDSRAVADLEGAAKLLRDRDDTSGAVASIGFCSGGRQSLLLASSSKALDAAVYCWGGFVTAATFEDETTEFRPTKVIDLVENLDCPIYMAIGAEDDNPSPDQADAVAARAREAGKDVEHKTYAGAGHAFFADYRESYEPTAAAELWDDVRDFLGRHLN